jgi:hypothetical protein
MVRDCYSLACNVLQPVASAAAALAAEQQQQQQQEVVCDVCDQLASMAVLCLTCTTDAAAAAELLDQELMPPVEQLLATAAVAAAPDGNVQRHLVLGFEGYGLATLAVPVLQWLLQCMQQGSVQAAGAEADGQSSEPQYKAVQR